MRKTDWTPSIVPSGDDQTVYLVAEDFGKLGRAWREADYEETDLETVIQDLLSGQYNNPIRCQQAFAQILDLSQFSMLDAVSSC